MGQGGGGEGGDLIAREPRWWPRETVLYAIPAEPRLMSAKLAELQKNSRRRRTRAGPYLFQRRDRRGGVEAVESAAFRCSDPGPYAEMPDENSSERPLATRPE